MTLFLVRHGSAGTRNDADPSDDRRPLDERGHRQAELIAGRLTEAAPTKLVSSPYLRCRQTLEPLAAALGVELCVDKRLAEGTDVDDAWSLVEELAAGVAVLCSHGDVIPDLIRRAQLRGMEIPGKAGCSKGSVWTLHGWDGDRFELGTYESVKARD